MIAGCTDVCPGTFRGPAWSPGMAPDSVSLRDARRQLGKTCRLVVRGGEVVADVVCAVGKHPLQNSPSLEWFAL